MRIFFSENFENLKTSIAANRLNWWVLLNIHFQIGIKSEITLDLLDNESNQILSILFLPFRLKYYCLLVTITNKIIIHLIYTNITT